MGQEGSVSMRCPPHHTQPASITTKLRRFLRKRRSFSKFSPTFFEITRTILSPTALTLLSYSLIQIFSSLFSRWENPLRARACTRAYSNFALFAFTTFTNLLITSYLTIYYNGIRNNV